MKGLLFVGLMLCSVRLIHADIIVQWSFNSIPSDNDAATGTLVPSVGNGTAQLLNGTTATFSSGGTNDPSSSFNDSGWNTSDYPPDGSSNKTAGVQFTASTLAYSNIVVRWDHRVSGTASKYFRLQYSTDGTTFTDYPTPIASQAVVSTASYYESKTNDLTAIAGVNDNPNFAVRIVSEFQNSATGSGTNGYLTTYGTNTYSRNGTVRFDWVTILGTAIPGANTPPTISLLTNQTIRVNQSSAALPFTIGDAQDPASNLTLNKLSSNPAVISEANIVFGGSDANRTVTVTAGDQTGSSLITVYVIDTGGRSNHTSFLVTVLPANTAPVISSIPHTNTLVNTTSPAIGFTVFDLETAAGALNVSGSSSNLALVPNANFAFGGADSNRTVSITPAPAQTGVAPLSITVSDGTNTATASFALMVTPSPTIIFYDPFAYPDGSVLSNSAVLWDNRSGTLGQAQVTNGQLLVTTSQTEDVVAPLIGAPYNVSNNFVLYSAFKATFLSLPKTVPDYFAHFASGSTLRGRVFAGTTNAGPGNFRLHVANGSDTATELPNDLQTNVAYTIVTRYNIDNPATTLWLNPASESSSSISAADTQSASRITSYGFRQDGGLGATILIDDLKVGLSFSAVLGTNFGVPPIPLKIQLISGKAVLSWSDPAFNLQSASTVSGTYTNVPSATSPYTNAIGPGSKFFRLRHD